MTYNRNLGPRNAFTIDTTDFDKALLEYSVASKKTFAESVNRQVKNMALQGQKLIKVASKEQIGRMLDIQVFRRTIYQRYMMKYFTGEIDWKHDWSTFVKPITHHKILAFGKKILRYRQASVGFLRFFFRMLAKEADRWAKGATEQVSARFKNFRISMTPATEADPTNHWVVQYYYKQRNDKTARRTEKLLWDIMPQVYATTIADMEKYIQRKMQEAGRKWGAR